WPQLRKLPRLTLGFVLSELRHDFRGKEFESFADVFVPVLPALLDKYRLVHTRILESAQRFAQFRGRADASGAPAEHLSAELITHRQIAVPEYLWHDSQVEDRWRVGGPAVIEGQRREVRV